MAAAISWSALATGTLLIGMWMAYRGLVGPRCTAPAAMGSAACSLEVKGAVVDAFAAGALLVMLTDSMIPESFEHGGREAGLALVIGFGAAVAVSLLQLS